MTLNNSCYNRPLKLILLNLMKSIILQKLIQDKTCFKHSSKPICIDLVITNTPKCFQNATVMVNMEIIVVVDMKVL